MTFGSMYARGLHTTQKRINKTQRGQAKDQRRSELPGKEARACVVWVACVRLLAFLRPRASSKSAAAMSWAEHRSSSRLGSYSLPSGQKTQLQAALHQVPEISSLQIGIKLARTTLTLSGMLVCPGTGRAASRDHALKSGEGQLRPASDTQAVLSGTSQKALVSTASKCSRMHHCRKLPL